MLFMCHQMAMDHEAQQKEQQQKQPKQQVIAQNKPIEVSKRVTGPIVWVLGGPGSGKGTQCAKIVEKYNLTHLSTGDLLREEVASGSAKGQELQEIMKRGELVSNDEVLGLLHAAMLNVKDKHGFLIDGYPRQKDQGHAFEKNICPVDIILYFECKNETMVKRIMNRAAESTEKRADDNEETIKTRIETFSKNTNEILELYPEKTKRIDAERGVDEIFVDVELYMDELVEVYRAKQAAKN